MPERPTGFDRPVFVTGLPRSGTSLVAGCLAACGLWSGTTVPGNPFNPKGYFEHSVIRERLMKPILSGHGFDPLGVSPLPPPDFAPWPGFAAPGAPGLDLCGILARILSAEGHDPATPWLYKDAKLTLLWRSFHRAFPAARWIIVRRPRADFIRSCRATPFMARHSTDPAFWETFAAAYEARLDALAAATNATQIESAPLARGDFTAFERLARSLGLRPDRAALAAFVTPEHWHFGSRAAPDLAPTATKRAGPV